MRKICIMLILSLLIPLLSFSLDMMAGIKGGPSINHFMGDDWEEWRDNNVGDGNKLTLGYSVGGFVSVNLTKNIAFQPEFYFTLTGGGAQASGYPDYVYKEKIMVLEIPVLLNMGMSIGKMRASLLAGVDFMINVGDYKWETESPDNEGTHEYDNLKSFYIGLVGGVALDIPISAKTYFLIDVRYVFMLTSMFEDFEQKSNSLKFMGGLGFKL